MSAQAVGVKVTATLATFILMVLLTQDDYGIYALALGFRVLLDVTSRLGMREVLVQRHARFRRWATPAFWITMMIGLVAAALIAGSAPLLARGYDEPDLKGMLWILAAVSPILAAGMIPHAKLQSQMRFRAIAVVEFLTNSSGLIATVLLAWAGLGPFSFVIPMPFVEAARAVAFWRLARPRVRMTLQFRRWRYLFSDTSNIFIANLLNRVVAQSDYLIIGMFHATAVVGAYSVAFRLSMQSMQVITGNLTQTLMPALNKLQTTTERQTQAFLRAARMLSVIYTPVCLLQAAVAEPVLRLLYGEKWIESIAILQILSVGMMFRILNGPSTALLRAQGRFRANMIVQSVYTAAFVIAVFVSASLSGTVAVAIAVSALGMCYGPVQAHLGIQMGGGTWRDVLGVYRESTPVGIVAFGLGYASHWLIPTDWPAALQYTAQIVLIAVIGCGLYAALLRLLFPALWSALIEQLQQLNPLRRRRPQTPIEHPSGA